MTYRESKNGDLKTEKVVRISLNKAIVIILTSVLSSAGVSFWGGLRTANAIPFQIQAIEKEVELIKSERSKLMPLDLSLEKWRQNDLRLDRIERKIDDIIKVVK